MVIKKTKKISQKKVPALCSTFIPIYPSINVALDYDEILGYKYKLSATLE